MTPPPDPPDWLAGEARTLWAQVCEDLLDRGRLEQADRRHIGLYCQTLADYVAWIDRPSGEDENRDLKLLDRLRGLAKDLGLNEPLDPAAASLHRFRAALASRLAAAPAGGEKPKRTRPARRPGKKGAGRARRRR